MKALIVNKVLCTVWPKLPVYVIGVIYRAHRRGVEKCLAVRWASLDWSE